MGYLNETLQPYFEYLPYFMVALLSSFVLTPLVGFVLKKAGIIDLSAIQARVGEKKLLKKINKTVALRAGGLAVVIPFLIMMLVTCDIDKQVGAIFLSVIILTIGGVYDDKYKSGKAAQFIPQVLAALIVVAAGIRIDRVQNPFGESYNLRWLMFPFQVGGGDYSLVFPADFLTIIWIILIINGVNWVFGINALGEGVATIAFLTILLISVKLSSPLTAVLSAILAGNMLGLIPFTLYPARILSATTGSNVYGFLIAILSIMGGAKVSVTVIVLIIPLLDMLWVMVGRIQRSGISNVFETIKVVTMGDHTHLHHRLLKLGFSVTQVAILEWIAISICAVIAFISADLPKVTIIGIISVVVLIVFYIISMLLKRRVRIRQDEVERKQDKGDSSSPESPESRYAY